MRYRRILLPIFSVSTVCRQRAALSVSASGRRTPFLQLHGHYPTLLTRHHAPLTAPWWLLPPLHHSLHALTPLTLCSATLHAPSPRICPPSPTMSPNHNVSPSSPVLLCIQCFQTMPRTVLPHRIRSLWSLMLLCQVSSSLYTCCQLMRDIWHGSHCHLTSMWHSRSLLCLLTPSINMFGHCRCLTRQPSINHELITSLRYLYTSTPPLLGAPRSRSLTSCHVLTSSDFDQP